MAQRSLPLTFALLALAACSDSEAKERLRQNARATWDSTLEVAEETGASALEALQARLAELEPRLRKLQAKASELHGQAREATERMLAELELERAALKQKLDDLRGQGGLAMERLKSEAAAELERMHERLDRMLGRGG